MDSELCCGYFLMFLFQLVCWHKEPQNIMKPVCISEGSKQEWEDARGKIF